METFPKIEFQLTDEQLEALKPFADEVARDSRQNLIAEVGVIPSDWKYRKVQVRLLDGLSVCKVTAALGAAQAEYGARRIRERRLNEIQEALVKGGLSASPDGETLTVHYDGCKYELKEIE